MNNRNYTRSDANLIRVYAYLTQQRLPFRRTQTDMARDLGLSRATINYALRHLRRQGIIAMDTARRRTTVIERVRTQPQQWSAVSPMANGLPALTAYVTGATYDHC